MFIISGVPLAQGFISLILVWIKGRVRVRVRVRVRGGLDLELVLGIYMAGNTMIR